jgi:hypothetical protein
MLTLPRALALTACAALAGCAVRPSPPPPAGGDVLPIVRLEAGRPDTLTFSVGTATPARFAPPPGVRVEVLADGRVVVEARDGFADVAFVPFTVGDEAYALAVDAAPGPNRLSLTVEGIDGEDPTLLRFSVRPPSGSGVSLDEEEGVVALLDDRPYPDNAVDAFDGTIVLDLDAAEPGHQRLRLAARTDDRVSNWVELDLVDGRPVD